MASAKCPVCEDIVTIGIHLKLYESIPCPTCLANLQVVSVNPFELEKLEIGRKVIIKNNRQKQGKGTKDPNKRIMIDYFGGEDEEEDIDDYILERRLRYKSERDKRRNNKPDIL